MSEELSLQELKSYLWESVSILRGSIGAADFKNCIGHHYRNRDVYGSIVMTSNGEAYELQFER